MELQWYHVLIALLPFYGMTGNFIFFLFRRSANMKDLVVIMQYRLTYEVFFIALWPVAVLLFHVILIKMVFETKRRESK